MSPGTILLLRARKTLWAARFYITRRPKISLESNPGELEALICSPGGVATTFLMSHAGKWLRLNDLHDEDGLKHPRVPPSGNVRVLYLTGDPADCVSSFKRRGFLLGQAAKLGSLLGMVKGPLQDWAIMRKIRQQHDAFVAGQRSGQPIMVVHYDDLWANVEKIREFLQIEDRRFVSEFPERQPRTKLS